jgi:tetrapyrrole methylase family protein / MazG family protein
MQEFDKLIDVADTLMGPDGCPWDHEQTFFSLQPYLLEEAHECIEAVDLEDIEGMVEELGDLFYIIIFFAKIGEKEEKFTLEDVIRTVKEKLVRRHPHVFSDVKADTIEEIADNWAKIKKNEKKKNKNRFPPTMPSMLKAQKLIKKYAKKSMPLPKEDDFQSKLIELIYEADQNNLDCEGELRRAIERLEKNAGEEL